MSSSFQFCIPVVSLEVQCFQIFKLSLVLFVNSFMNSSFKFIKLKAEDCYLLYFHLEIEKGFVIV